MSVSLWPACETSCSRTFCAAD